MATAISAPPSAVERMLRRDRLVVASALATITLFAWLYLIRESTTMQSMAIDARVHAAMGMADMRTWGLADWFALFLMWTVMMAGMMLPSAAPVILLVLAVYRRRGDQRARVSSVAFTAGYLLAWTTFSAAAAAIQVALHRGAWLTADMASVSPIVAGVVLVLAGLYQWLPIKNACLMHCQSPLGFLTRHWQEGARGGLNMGLRHGLFCVGCCWLLMSLLFVVGVMNLLWVAVIAGFVLAERLLRQGTEVGGVGGGLLIIWGIYTLAR
jgi:predicted metal-binding membrane protein